MRRQGGNESARCFTWINYAHGCVSTKHNKAPWAPHQHCHQPFSTFYFSGILQSPVNTFPFYPRVRRKDIKIPDLLQIFSCSRSQFFSVMLIISAKPASHPHAGEFLKVPSPPSLSAETEVHSFLPVPNSLLNLLDTSAAFSLHPFLDSHKKAVSEVHSLFVTSAANLKSNVEESCFKEKDSEENKCFLIKNKEAKLKFSDDNLQYVAKCQWGWEWE